MYKSGYVVSVRHGGQTVPEEGDRVTVPFNEEYELRLRNKNGKDAIAFVYIDGKVVVEDGLIIPAHKFIDLERYVTNGDLSQGRRFKFVPLENGQVKDKSEPDNGIIEVRFHEEKEIPKLEFKVSQPPHYVFSHHCHSSHCWSCGRMHCTCCPCNPGLPWNRPRYGGTWCGQSTEPRYGSSILRGSSAGGASEAMGMAVGATPTSYNLNASQQSLLNAVTHLKTAEAGATVEGSISSQKFSTRHFEYVKDTSTILTLKLVGVRKAVPEGKFCTSCGTKKAGKYCSGCGDLLLP